VTERTRRPRGVFQIRELVGEASPNLVFFSSVSENTRRFVDKLQMPAVRIPLRPRVEGMIRVSRPYVLIVPSYGGGDRDGAVPKQVIHFLNDSVNRSLIRGVITAGNTNFGEHYCISGPIISAKCQVPELYRFELLGTDLDVQRVREGLVEFWANQQATECDRDSAQTQESA
jgi:protein involved in ribonucleotide reduction